MTFTTEQKVGLFFLIGLAILGVMTFKAENLGNIFQRKTLMYVRFPHASGLKPKDTVAIAGVKVGEIQAVDLQEDGVRLTLGIDTKARIRKDAIAIIAWGGLLGNRYIDISLGSPSQPFLNPGDEIQPGESVEITQVLAKINSAATELQDLLKSSGAGPKFSSLLDNLLKISEDISGQRGTLGKIIGSDEMYQKVNGIADDLKGASSRLSKMLADNDKRINSIIENLDTAVPEAKDAFAAIKRLGEQTENGKGLLPALLKDEQMYQDLKNSLSRLSSSLDRIDALTKSAQEGRGLVARLVNDEQLANHFADAVKSLSAIAVRLETGDSTLARLSRDDDMYKDMKKVLADARETLRSVKEQVPLGTFASVLLASF